MACTRGLYSPAIQQQEENRKPIQQHLIPIKSLKTATDGGWGGVGLTYFTHLVIRPSLQPNTQLSE